ncbi:hypothetical protein [Kordia sp.]|uniref:hypothetical protein n=1 Tax=Kordia sp. TaxID=1965332 RepID=UPI003B5C9873
MKSSKKKGFKQYILVSLGELVLIIAGILIAMNINNWNENRIALTKANLYIDKVKKDLTIDTTYFHYAIERIDLKLDYKKSLFNQDSIAKFSTSGLQAIVTSGTNNIYINDGAYKKIIESGIVTLPEKEFLFEKFNSYYVVFNNYLKELNKWEEKSAQKDQDFWIYQNHYELAYIDVTKSILDSVENRKNFIKVMTSMEGKNYNNMAILREQRMKEIYTRARDRAKKLMKQIDSIQN